MKLSTNYYSLPARLLFGTVAASCAWFAAFAIEAATRLMAGLFVQFGADLPTPTLLTINAVQSYVPWIIAAASTLFILYLGMRASVYFLYVSTVVAAGAAVLASFVVLALTLPMMNCGVAWPEWPRVATQSSGAGQAPDTTLKENTPGRTRAGSCG